MPKATVLKNLADDIALAASDGLDLNESGIMRRARNILGVTVEDMGVCE